MLDSQSLVCSNLNRFETVRQILFCLPWRWSLRRRRVLKARCGRRSFIDMNDIAVITLSRGHGFALVDRVDFESLNRHRWSTIPNGYVVRYTTENKKRRTYLLHREVMNAPKGMEVDHINGTLIDNRRCNLRICTPSQNQANQVHLSSDNTSGFLGVFRGKTHGTWIAQVTVRYRRIHLGTFSTKEDAARAYNAAKLQYWGEFAGLNKIL
jgi:hypothetical protein